MSEQTTAPDTACIPTDWWWHDPQDGGEAGFVKGRPWGDGEAWRVYKRRTEAMKECRCSSAPTAYGMPDNFVTCPSCGARVGWWSYDAKQHLVHLFAHIAETGADPSDAGAGRTMSEQTPPSDSDLDAIANVGDLRRLIVGQADDVPVRIHFGWDLAIVESGFDDHDGAVLLFADTDAGVSSVSTAWMNQALDRAGFDR